MHQEIRMQYIVIRKKYILKYDLDYYDVIFLIKYFTGFISSTFMQIIIIKLDLIENKPNIKPTRKKNSNEGEKYIINLGSCYSKLYG